MFTGNTLLSDALGENPIIYGSRIITKVFPSSLEKNRGPETQQAHFRSLTDTSLFLFRKKVIQLRIVDCPFLHELASSGILNTTCRIRDTNICCAHPETTILLLLTAAQIARKIPGYNSDDLCLTELKTSLLRWREMQLCHDEFNGSIRTRISLLESNLPPEKRKNILNKIIQDIEQVMSNQAEEVKARTPYYDLLKSMPFEQWYAYNGFSAFREALSQLTFGGSNDDCRRVVDLFHKTNKGIREKSFGLIQPIRSRILFQRPWNDISD